MLKIEVLKPGGRPPVSRMHIFHRHSEKGNPLIYGVLNWHKKSNSLINSPNQIS
jgi:hypothetical protein